MPVESNLPDVVDILGVGYGPSNLGLAIALQEHNAAVPARERLTSVFVERQSEFKWHTGMLLPGATMQISFLKDLATQRNTRSEFTFLNYLEQRGRLTHFINLQTFFPSRIEFHDYLSWAADKVRADVHYGTSATAVAWNGRHFEVTTRSAAGSRTLRARNIVLAGGLTPKLPDDVDATDRVFHNHRVLDRLDALPSVNQERFVVVGAGPTGVEMAGQIAELAHRTLRRDFRAINTRTARVVLVDAAGQVLPPFGAKLGEKTKKELEKLGVEVKLGAMVTDVDERGLDMKHRDGTVERIESVCKIWAAGVQASPLARTLSEQTGAPLDRAGRIGVNPDLTLPGHPEVFVVGDMIALDNLPGVAQVAIQGAKYAAKEIDGRIKGRPSQPPFKYFDKGSMATISRFRAVAMIGKLRLTGFIAWLMWLAVHLVYITGFKNRVTAVLHWFVSFLGRGRSERTATEQQIFARSALSRLERGAQDLVSDPGSYDDKRIADESERRAALEERALEEARLTDAGERGVRVGG